MSLDDTLAQLNSLAPDDNSLARLWATLQEDFAREKQAPNESFPSWALTHVNRQILNICVDIEFRRQIDSASRDQRSRLSSIAAELRISPGVFHLLFSKRLAASRAAVDVIRQLNQARPELDVSEFYACFSSLPTTRSLGKDVSIPRDPLRILKEAAACYSSVKLVSRNSKRRNAKTPRHHKRRPDSFKVDDRSVSSDQDTQHNSDQEDDFEADQPPIDDDEGLSFDNFSPIDDDDYASDDLEEVPRHEILADRDEASMSLISNNEEIEVVPLQQYPSIRRLSCNVSLRRSHKRSFSEDDIWSTHNTPSSVTSKRFKHAVLQSNALQSDPDLCLPQSSPDPHDSILHPHAMQSKTPGDSEKLLSSDISSSSPPSPTPRELRRRSNLEDIVDSFRTLEPTTWLNDTIVHVLTRRLASPDVGVVDPLVIRAAKGDNLRHRLSTTLSKPVVLMPFNSGHHWVLYKWTRSRTLLERYDSMGGDDGGGVVAAMPVVEFVEWAYAMRGSVDLQQAERNTWDCGVFCIQVAQHVAARAPLPPSVNGDISRAQLRQAVLTSWACALRPSEVSGYWYQITSDSETRIWQLREIRRRQHHLAALRVPRRATLWMRLGTRAWKSKHAKKPDQQAAACSPASYQASRSYTNIHYEKPSSSMPGLRKSKHETRQRSR
ncbi:hypothetical protein Ct61P_14594 [Colletotrichum tofieldiae]|nr:hypothetical protein Ct61P_14594 [Colletotrichum tofieldiae]